MFLRNVFVLHMLSIVMKTTAILMAVCLIGVIALIAFEPSFVSIDLVRKQWWCVVVAMILLRLSLLGETFINVSITKRIQEIRSSAWKAKAS